MHLATITFVAPTIGALLRLLLSSTQVGLFMHGPGTKVDGGQMHRHPELPRQLRPWPFSPALSFRCARVFGLSANRFRQTLLMVPGFVVPIALVLACVVGLLG